VSQFSDNRQVGVVLTCHNRKATTLRCLRALTDCRTPPGVRIHIFLTDDGSVDGTSDAVRCEFGAAKVLKGDGSLFWNGGMRLALEAAMADECDYFLLLNDDTFLLPDALVRLFQAEQLAVAKSGEAVCIVGTTADPKTGTPTYGGRISCGGIHRTRHRLIFDLNEIRECETFNGNCVLIPAPIISEVGNLDPVFIHTMADYDYGYRIRKKGFSIWCAPGIVALCSENDPKSYRLEGGSPWSRVRSAMHPRRFPPKAWFAFTHRHAGPLWILHWLHPYVMAFVGYFAFSRKEGYRRQDGGSFRS